MLLLDVHSSIRHPNPGHNPTEVFRRYSWLLAIYQAAEYRSGRPEND